MHSFYSETQIPVLCCLKGSFVLLGPLPRVTGASPGVVSPGRQRWHPAARYGGGNPPLASFVENTTVHPLFLTAPELNFKDYLFRILQTSVHLIFMVLAPPRWLMGGESVRILCGGLQVALPSRDGHLKYG
ncbi:hypothetical protein HJG60_008627 [Phyllostomus discolor]|uniref:Uncharacterized protein n=1 Tax=Phyllostomus discolor TaxID=89673 RepID=A0A834DLA4_9CHIR|nr:hypothetical protein HJG60_008627 [Phyllostomus discolor]